MKPIPQMAPWFDDQEAKAVNDYLKSGGWITEFTKTRDFEAAICQYTGAAFCSITTSGTAALFLSLVALGLKPGDEVIVPAFTMAATPNAVLLAGGRVVFSDISPSTLCLDTSLAKTKISPRTKAIIIVSLNGRSPDDLEEFINYCHSRGLFVIEDAAQSLGSLKSGRHLGTFGDLGIFSFSAPKIITTGQGGAIITNNESLFKKIGRLRDFGRAASGSDHYLEVGWNFKFTDLQAVIGLTQISKLSWRVNRKKEIYKRYYDQLAPLHHLEFISTNLNDTSPWFIDLLIKNTQRDSLIKFLKEKAIGTRPFYPSLPQEPAYQPSNGHYPISDTVASKGLWLPSSSQLQNEEIDFVCTQIKTFFSYA